MNSLDPHETLSIISINPDCPKDLVFTVRWIKLMMKYKDIKLETDLEILVNYFLDSVNSIHNPNSTIEYKWTKDAVEKRLKIARDWIWNKEVI